MTQREILITHVSAITSIGVLANAILEELDDELSSRYAAKLEKISDKVYALQKEILDELGIEQ